MSAAPASVDVKSPFVRHPANPIIDVADLTGAGVLAFNPGVIRTADGWSMALRVDEGTTGDSNITGSHIAFATSEDGVSWTLQPDLALDRDDALALLQSLEPHRPLDEELWRIYDPRLLEIDGEVVLSFAADTTHGLRPGLARRTAAGWEAVALGPPDDRNNVVFPELIDGRYHRLQRPMHEYGGEALGAGKYGIWTSASPDLVHWGDTRFIADRSIAPYANDKIGPGAPPLRTEMGWLCLFHAVSVLADVTQRGWEASWEKTYVAGALLLDLDDPSRLVAAAPIPALAPEAPYETEGFRNDVIFPTAAVAVDGDVWMYYGAADTVIGLATAPIDAVVEFVLSGPRG